MKAILLEFTLLASISIGLVGCAGVTPGAGAIQHPNWIKVGKIREIDLSSLERSGDLVTYRSRDAGWFARFRVSANCSTFERQELENTQVKGVTGQIGATYPDTEHRREVEAACRFASTSIVATAAIADDSTTVFVEQDLEPTGGKIQRPKDWYYTEAHKGASYRWIISKEDASGGRQYKTGLSLQTFVGVKEGTGKTAEQFIRDFAASRIANGKSLRECQATPQGIFERICLEMEEGPYRVLYSMFWGAEGLDIAVVSVAGAPKEDWQRIQPIFARMAAFEIIDMKRFPKK